MRKWIGLSLAAAFVGVYVLPLGVRPLIRPDEDRYAEIPREMVASGDWVVPRLDGLRYFEKPAGGYWLIALSTAALGQNRLAVRLPSALSAGATALVLFLLVRRFGGGWRPAALAAAILLTSLGVFAVGTFAVLDMPLALLLTAALACFTCADRAESRGRAAGYLALFGLCCGGAFLVKGFLAFVVPAAVAVPYLVWERRGGRLLRLAWVPLVVVVAVAGPWALLVHQREPDFWRYFFWEEHVKRFLSADAQHPEPLWYYVPIILGAMLPWTALLPAAAMGLRRVGLGDRFGRFAACWFLFPFLFFSASKGKLGGYILPCLPPLALLMSRGLLGCLEGGRARAFEAGARILAGVALAAGAGLVLWQLGVFPGALYAAGEAWKWGLLVAGVAVAAGLALLAARARGAGGRLVLFAAAPWLLLFSMHFGLPKAGEDWCSPGDVLERNAWRVRPDQPIFADMNTFRSVCWHYRRADVGIIGTRQELDYGLSYPDAHDRHFGNWAFPRYLASCPKDTVVTVFMTPWRFTRIKGPPPRPLFEDRTEGYVFVQYPGGQRPPKPAAAEADEE